VDGGIYPIESIILAHAKYPARRTWSVLGAERYPKSFWGEAKKEQQRIYLKMYLPD